jgi:hypothetical protein
MRIVKLRCSALCLLFTLLVVWPCSADQFPITREYTFEHWIGVSDTGSLTYATVESEFSFDADLSPVLPGQSLTITNFVSCLYTCTDAVVSSAPSGQPVVMTVLLNGGGDPNLDFSHAYDTYTFSNQDAQFYAYVNTPVTISVTSGPEVRIERWQMSVANLVTTPEVVTSEVANVLATPEPAACGLVLLGACALGIAAFHRVRRSRIN